MAIRVLAPLLCRSKRIISGTHIATFYSGKYPDIVPPTEVFRVHYDQAIARVLREEGDIKTYGEISSEISEEEFEDDYYSDKTVEYFMTGQIERTKQVSTPCMYIHT